MTKEKSKMKNDTERLKSDIKKRSYLYALKTIAFLETLPNNQTCRVLSNQLLRSATSVGANIIEAQAAPTRKDFTNFLNYSLKSANESKFWIALLRDSKQADRTKAETLLQETEEISKILGSSIITLRGKRNL